MENWEIAELKKEIDKVRKRITVLEKHQIESFQLIQDFFTLLFNFSHQSKLWLSKEEEEEDV